MLRPVKVVERYPTGLRLLHWLVAALIVLQLATAMVNAMVYENAPNVAEAAVQAHVSIGVLVMGLMLLRLGLRLSLPLPPLPEKMGRAKRALAHATHLALYAVLIALPVSGWLKLAALGYPVSAFGVLPLPVLDFMPDIARRARRAHELLAMVLGGLLVLHIGAAVFHKRLAGTTVLPRMGLGQVP